MSPLPKSATLCKNRLLTLAESTQPHVNTAVFHNSAKSACLNRYCFPVSARIKFQKVLIGGIRNNYEKNKTQSP